MTVGTLGAAVIAVALMFYLLYVLLKPERF